MTGQSRRRRLAVSVVIGNVLMSAITITLVSLLAVWAVPAILQVEGTFSTWFSRRNDELTEAFAIEAVRFLPTETDIVVRNIGTKDIELVNIIIDGVPYSLACSPGFVSSPSPGFLPLPVGGTATVCLLRSVFNWQPKLPTDPPYFIKVTSSHGNENSGEKFWAPR